VSVAGKKKKGKSGHVQHALRAGRHWSGVLVALEIEQQQNEKHDDSQHEDAKTFSSAIRASCWYAFNHLLIKHENLAGIAPS
jgi:hypothetical protein